MNLITLSQFLHVVLLILLSICQTLIGPLSSRAMSEPGDTISGMNLTTGVLHALPVRAFCSPAYSSGTAITADCSAPASSRLAIGNIFTVRDNRIVSLDQSKLTWALSIDNQPIDLEAFGKITYTVPSMPTQPSSLKEVFRKVTAWDVVLNDLTPGEHILRGSAQTNSDLYTRVLHITVQGCQLG